jgi:hypothetical protein
MKVKILTLATLFFCSQMMVHAQTPTFQKGDKVLNLGLGFGGYAPSGYQVTTPSASASFEVGIKDNSPKKGSIGIGGYLGYAGYEEKHIRTTNPAATYGYARYFENSSIASNNNNYWSVNRIMIGVRGAYHYPLVDKLDTYGGVTLGVVARSWKWNGPVNRTDHPSRKPFGGDLFLGGRYYFSDQFAAMAELSLGTYLTLGVSMKI